MKKTTQQRPKGYSNINPPSIFQKDFGYTGQKFFRNYKCPVYRSTESSLVRFPYQMEDMISCKIITEDQLLRFMTMLESNDMEIYRLASTMLFGLRNELSKTIGKLI